MSVSDKGDMQNVQSSGSRGTGLKTTGLVCDGQFSFVTIYEVGKLEPLVPD